MRICFSLCRRVTDGGRKQQITLGKHGAKTAVRRRRRWTDFGRIIVKLRKKKPKQPDRRPTTDGTRRTEDGRKRGETRIWRERARKRGGDGGGGGAEVS